MASCSGIGGILGNRFIESPSHLPYNLKNSKPKTSSNQSHLIPTLEFIDPTQNSYGNKIIRKLYPPNSGLKNGYFVEAGALDGEYLSNTLYLEMELGWTGLLVEPSLVSYKKLRKKNRKAWTCHCCLGKESSMQEALLASYINFPRLGYFSPEPKETVNGKNFLVGSSNLQNVHQEHSNMIQYEKVQCLPLHSILKALNVSKIDLFSLDTEGTEQGILDSFPWEEVVVDVWIVEHKDLEFSSGKSRKPNTDQAFVTWFERKGYDSYFNNPDSEDYFFVRKNSSIQKSLKRIVKKIP